MKHPGSEITDSIKIPDVDPRLFPERVFLHEIPVLERKPYIEGKIYEAGDLEIFFWKRYEKNAGVYYHKDPYDPEASRANQKYKGVVDEFREKIERFREGKVTDDDSVFGLLYEAKEVLYKRFDPIDYTDSPVENGEYRYFMDRIFVPVLDLLEEQSSPKLAQKISAFTETLQTEFCTPMIMECARTIGGVRGSDGVPTIIEIVKRANKNYSENSPYAYGDEDLREPTYENYLLFGENDLYGLNLFAINVCRQLSASSEQGVSDLNKLLPSNSFGLLNEYVQSYQFFGLGVSVKGLLPLVRSEDQLTRKMSAAILYRLELGRLGISEEGVRYLGKLYDLGEMNKPGYFAQRLSPSGHIGVFDSEEKLAKYFELGDLSSIDEVIRPQVLDLTYEMLFIPKVDETPDERKLREELLQIFKEKYLEVYDDKFFSQTGVRINSLDLHEQGWFLAYYVKANLYEKEGLIRFAKQWGELGLKAFLVAEYGGSADDLMGFCGSEGVSLEQRRSVLSEFYILVGEAESFRRILKEAESGVDVPFANQAYEAFVRKSCDFLKAASIIASGKGGEVTLAELLINMKTLRFALLSLKDLTSEKSRFMLSRKGSSEEGALSVYEFEDTVKKDRIVIGVRSQSTNVGGARINFRVVNGRSREEARLAIDLIDVLESGKSLALDLGVGKIERAESGEKTFPTQRVGRVLGLVSAGGGHNEASFSKDLAGKFPALANGFKDYLYRRYL